MPNDNKGIDLKIEPARHVILYLQYNEQGELTHQEQRKVDQLGDKDQALLETIEKFYQAREARMVRAAIAATLEAVRDDVAVIEVNDMATIWDRFDLVTDTITVYDDPQGEGEGHAAVMYELRSKGKAHA